MPVNLFLFSPGAIAFPPNAHQQIVTMQQNAQQLAAQQQAQQQQAQQQQQQHQQVIKREPTAPSMAPQMTGGQQQSNSSNNSASAAAAAAAAAQNMEFMATVQNKDLLEELKVQSQAIVHKTITNGTPDGKQQMIRHYRCNRHRHQEKCPFKMLAIQSEDTTFKVFRSGEHNHAVVPSG
uniref:FLYWCH-type domain-containing protein n=1 Tax=Meloidogyne hapla TaxID=6305 RepID=A0A1I8B3C6_MELHA